MAIQSDTLVDQLDQQGLILRQIAARGYCDTDDLTQLRERLPATFERLREYHWNIGEMRGLRELAAEKLLPARFIARFL